MSENIEEQSLAKGCCSRSDRVTWKELCDEANRQMFAMLDELIERATEDPDDPIVVDDENRREIDRYVSTLRLDAPFIFNGVRIVSHDLQRDEVKDMPCKLPAELSNQACAVVARSIRNYEPGQGRILTVLPTPAGIPYPDAEWITTST